MLVIVWATFCDASVLLIVWALSVTRASPLLKGSYAVVNPPIKYITRDHQSDDDDDDDDDDDGQGW